MTTDLERALRDLAYSGDDAADEEAAAGAAARVGGAAASAGLLDVAYMRLDSPVGTLLASRTPRGLLTLHYEDDAGDRELERIAARVSPRILEAPGRFDDVRRELDEYFEGRRRRFDLPVDLALAAPFTRRVLAATARIRYGEVQTYAQVAAAAGSPRAMRATGNALGANPVPIVVPCHRVVRTGGALGGYGGGPDRKRRLLGIERGGWSAADAG